MIASIFFEFHLPNATTWFYFSLVLAIALFFKFGRLLCMRNLDILTLYLLVPGLLLLQEARSGTPPTGSVSDGPVRDPIWFCYCWLLAGSAYFLGRCLFDLALVSRPALGPNLNLSGLAWLAVAMSVCLITVALRRQAEPVERVGTDSVALDKVKAWAASRGPGPARPLDEAVVSPARFWIERGTAILFHLAVVTALVLIGTVHFQDTTAGMAAGTFYLLLPYTAIHMSQVHHVGPTALLVWAVYSYRRPALSGALLGVAAGTVFFPALAVPVWLSFYHRRGLRSFAAAFVLAAGATLALAAVVLWLDDSLAGEFQKLLKSSDWQPWKATRAEGFWAGVHWAYRLPVSIAYAAFVLTMLFWPAPKNLAHLIALSAACLIGVQFWYADRGGLYVLWYLPLLLLLVFRPNLADRQAPPPPVRGTDGLIRRLAARVGRQFRWPPLKMTR